MKKFTAKVLLPSNLYKTLERVQWRVLKAPNLNSGGCGVFAVAVAKELKKRGVDCEIITVGYGEDSSPVIVKNSLMSNAGNPKSCDDWDANGLTRDHVGVRFKHKRITYTYDSDVLYRSVREFGYRADDTTWKCKYPYGKGMSIEDMGKLVKTKSGWNTDFDRKHIATVKKIVKETFKEFY